MRVTKSRSRRIPRESSRHHPTPPRSLAALARVHTPLPSKTIENILTTEAAQALPPRISQQESREQSTQPTLVSLPRTPQNPTDVNPNQETEITDLTEKN